MASKDGVNKHIGYEPGPAFGVATVGSKKVTLPAAFKPTYPQAKNPVANRGMRGK
jgi:hypothetical protein